MGPVEVARFRRREDEASYREWAARVDSWRGHVSPADAWVAWLFPVFGSSDSAYFTGTYSDEYGYAHGLMKCRNVHRDLERFVDRAGVEFGLTPRRFITGVEKHRYRDILHLHAIFEGPFDSEQLAALKSLWASERGHCRVLPVTDGCASYVTKYALKGDCEGFHWRL